MASDAFPAGATAMVALAIYDCGPQSDKAVQVATEYLLKASPDTTKEVALQTIFLHRIGKPGAALLRRNLQWLIDAQIKEGPDAGSWSCRKEPVGQRGDGANTAYAILALSVATPAGKDGEATVPNEVWQIARSWLLKSQQDDGGWGIHDRNKTDDRSDDGVRPRRVKGDGTEAEEIPAESGGGRTSSGLAEFPLEHDDESRWRAGVANVLTVLDESGVAGSSKARRPGLACRDARSTAEVAEEGRVL